MAKAAPIRNDFSRGELSPEIYGRYDLEMYQHGAKTVQNLICREEHGATGIPGSIYIADGKTDGDKVALWPFVANQTTAYAIEFGALYVRFLKNDGTQVGAPYEVVSPFALADVFKLQFVKIGAALYIFHEDYDPRTLTWTSDASWAFATPSWTGQTFTGSGERPRACCLHENRLWVAKEKNSSGTSVLTLYGSKPFAYGTFTVGDLDDDGIEIEVAGGEGVIPLSMVSMGDLILVNTVGGEIVITGGNDLLVPATARARFLSDTGASRIQAQRMYETVLFVDRSGNQIVDYQPRAGEQAYQSGVLTAHAKHIANKADGTVGAFTQLAIQRHPQRLIWAVSDQGHAAVMSNKKESSVLAWSRYVTDASTGVLESVCVVPGTGAEDIVFFSVQRTVNGTTKRFLEYQKPYEWGSAERDAFRGIHCGAILDNGATIAISALTAASPIQVTTDAAHGLSDGDRVRIASCAAMPSINNLVFTVDNPSGSTFDLYDEYNLAAVDGSAYAYDSSAAHGTAEKVTKTMTGLSHLVAATVNIRYDGGTHAQKTVDSSGEVTLDEWANTIHAGLVATWILEPTAIVDAGYGGRQKYRVQHIIARFIKTLGVKGGISASRLFDIVFRQGTDPMGQAPPLFSGLKEIPVDGEYANEADYRLQSSEPQPVTILTAQPEVEANRK